jgi:hypothetical protein
MVFEVLMKFKDIKGLIGEGNYRCDVPLTYISEKIKEWEEEGMGGRLQLCPDFQRGHVWTPQQQTAFVEFILRGGRTGKDLYFNHPGWMGNWQGDFVCVDGLQRLTALLKFFKNKVPIFDGHFYKDFEDKLGIDIAMTFHVNNLKTRKEVLTWYYQFNAAGTPHTKEELDKVRAMIEAEG